MDNCHESDCKYGDQLVRLRKIEGQVKGIQKMIMDDRYCIDILVQIRSIKSALMKVEENILKKHILTCVTGAVRSGSDGEVNAKVNELMDIISRFA